MNQGKDIIDQGKEIIEHGKEQLEDARETIENIPNVISENVQEIISQGKDVLEGAETTHIHDVHEAVGNISPEDIAEAIQGNLPGIPITPEDIFNIADKFNDMHTAACAAVSANFNLQNAFCKDIKDIFRDQAKFITNQITKIIHFIQGRIVNVIERGQAVPPKTLDFIEKQANAAINTFEKLLESVNAPDAFTDIIDVLRETTNTNIAMAREYVSRVAGGQFGKMIEEIKNAIGGGVPAQIAVQNAVQSNIQQGISQFQEMQNQLQNRPANYQNAVAAVQSQVQQFAQVGNIMDKIKEKYQENMQNIRDKVTEAAAQIQGINLDAGSVFQHAAQEMIANAVENVQQNFQDRLQTAIQIPNHPEISQHIQGIFKNPFEDLQAEIEKIVYQIISDIINRIKDQIGNAAGILNEVENQDVPEEQAVGLVAPETQPGFGGLAENGGEADKIEGTNSALPSTGSGGSFVGDSSNGLTGTLYDPNRIFLTLI